MIAIKVLRTSDIVCRSDWKMSEIDSHTLTQHHVSADELRMASPMLDDRRRGRVNAPVTVTRYESISLADIETQQRLEVSNEVSSDDENSERFDCGQADGSGTRCELSDSNISDSNEQQPPTDSNRFGRRHTSLHPSEHPSMSKQARVDAAACVFGARATSSNDTDSEFKDDELLSIRSHTCAEDDLFPTLSVTCVGCNLCQKIAIVDKFIDDNLMRIEETSLFKLAAEVFKRITAETQREV